MFKFLKNLGKVILNTAKMVFSIIYPKKINIESIKEIENTLYKADFCLGITDAIVCEIKDELTHKKQLLLIMLST